jgi:hypothetical protein
VPNGDGLATDSGVACMVERQGSSWSVVEKLMASDGAAGDRFGASVALLGDVALVGAPARDASGGLADAGAAYLFRRVGGAWTEVARADGTTTAEAFGESVAVSATHALVGVRRDDAAATDAGAAVVFDLATDLAAGARFLSPLADGNDQFGIAVALDGDTALVGAFDEGFDQGPLAQHGAGFLFRVGGLDADADGLPDSCETFTGAPFCFGDGSGSACPCGNASAAGANAGCKNSLGRGGRLMAQGAASVAADGLVFTAAYLPPLVPVLVFQGDAQVAGGSGVALGDGLRCAGGAIVRIAKPAANAAGSAEVGAGIAGVLVSDAGAIPAAGGARCYQGWYRNEASYCSSATFNLTNAVSVTWTP